jgi:hypothetical protein
MAKSLARRGDTAEAVEMGASAVRLAAATVDIELHADALTELAEVHRLAGGEDEEEPRLREALALYEQKGDIVRMRAVRDRLTAVAAR